MISSVCPQIEAAMWKPSIELDLSQSSAFVERQLDGSYREPSESLLPSKNASLPTANPSAAPTVVGVLLRNGSEPAQQDSEGLEDHRWLICVALRA